MRRFIAQGKNEGFTCLNCGLTVLPLSGGGCRNHCPACLHSLHVDENPGDRASGCGGVLEPVGVLHSGKKGWVIVHRCAACGATRRNKAALGDPVQPDDFERVLELSRKPVP
jgi:hypothetical protein